MTGVLDYVERRPRRRRLRLSVTLGTYRAGAAHFAFAGALADMGGYLIHWPVTEALGKFATIIACVALYLEHAEQARIERRLKL